MSEYVHPEVLVSTEWVEKHGSDDGVRVMEVDEDVLLYEQGHVPGALKLDWHTELQRPDIRGAERRLAAQTARIGVAQADLYPRFDLLGTIGLEAYSAG
ncbi:MAG: hypothetical protein P8Y02_12315, partial [Deinococcales bacterium]